MENTMKEEHLPKKYIVGIAVRTANFDGSAQKDIPAIFNRFFEEQILSKIPNKSGTDFICLYTDYEGDYTAPYTCLVGCEVSSLDVIPEGMVAKELPAANYAVFSSKPEEILKTWQHIWKSDLDRAYIGDFQVYSQDSPEVKVYVGLKNI